MIIELFGAIATLLVGISFVFEDIRLIRWFNLTGSVFFVVYGFEIGAIWTAILNLGMILVNGWHLMKIYKGDKNGRENK